MNADMSEFWSGALYLKGNPLALAVFGVVTRNLGISGYGIAKQLDQNPELVQQALSSLREKQMVSGSAALTDNYTLTGLGFGVKEVMEHGKV